jgi:hypothetical protein
MSLEVEEEDSCSSCDEVEYLEIANHARKRKMSVDHYGQNNRRMSFGSSNISAAYLETNDK